EGVYEYKGDDGAPVNLDTTDYSQNSLWNKLDNQDFEDILFPNLGNLTDSNSMAMGGMVVMNEVRGEVEAYIESAEVAAGGDVDVEAVEDASIRAIAKSTVSSSGGSAFGEGNSVARNGQIVTNLVLSSADAFVNDSTLVSTAPDVLFSDTDTDPTTVNPRDTVHIDDASLFDDGDGVAGRTYRFLGGASEAIVLVDEDFTDTTRWQLLEEYDRDVAVTATNAALLDATLRSSTQ